VVQKSHWHAALLFGAAAIFVPVGALAQTPVTITSWGAPVTVVGGNKPGGPALLNADGKIPSNLIDGGGGGSYTLPPATTSTLGGVKVGTGLAVTTDGTVSVNVDLSGYLPSNNPQFSGTMKDSSDAVELGSLGITLKGSGHYLQTHWDGNLSFDTDENNPAFDWPGPLTISAQSQFTNGLQGGGGGPNSSLGGFSQGWTLGWNALNGTTGETDFINSHGGGSGGFAWFNTTPSDWANSHGTPIMNVDASGALTTNGGMGSSALAGSGNAYACLDSAGKLYRSATACQ